MHIPIWKIELDKEKEVLMKAIELKTKLKNNSIHIPQHLKIDLPIPGKKDIHVIVLFDESEKSEEKLFQTLSQEQFLKEYTRSDSVYDTY